MKRLSADDSADYPRESRTSSGTFEKKSPASIEVGLFFFGLAKMTSSDVVYSMGNVPVKLSFLLATVLACVHFAAGATLVPLALSTDLRVVVATVIALSLMRSIWVHAMLRAQHSIVGIAIEDQESCILQTRSGAILPARILGSTYVTSMLTVINVKPAGTYFARHILLLPDSIEPEEFRKLRTLLRWARPTHP